MTTQVMQAGKVMQAGLGPAVRPIPRPRFHPAHGPSPVATIRWVATFTLLVVALCGMLAISSLTDAGNLPPEGPLPANAL